MKEDGPPGATSNGFNENLALFNAGKCGMWIDATVAASFVTDPKQSQGRRQGRLRAGARTRASARTRNWLWAWALAIPAGSQEGRRGREVHHLGDQQGLHQAGRRQGRLGQRAARHAQVALRNPRVPEGGAVRQADAGLDQLGRSRTSRRSSRCPTSACSSRRSPSSRRSAPRSASRFSRRSPARRRSTQALKTAQAAAEREMKQGRLHQVSRRPSVRKADPDRPPRTSAVAVRMAAALRHAPPLRRAWRLLGRFDQRSGQVTTDRQERMRHDACGRAPDGAGGRAALRLDDRAAGDDDLLLVPATTTCSTRDRQPSPASRTSTTSSPTRPSRVAAEHAGAGRLGARRSPSCSASCSRC